MINAGYYVEFSFWCLIWFGVLAVTILLRIRFKRTRFSADVLHSITLLCRVCFIKFVAIVLTFPDYIKDVDPFNRAQVCMLYINYITLYRTYLYICISVYICIHLYTCI